MWFSQGAILLYYNKSFGRGSMSNCEFGMKAE